jgi:hypothetical protein
MMISLFSSTTKLINKFCTVSLQPRILKNSVSEEEEEEDEREREREREGGER